MLSPWSRFGKIDIEAQLFSGSPMKITVFYAHASIYIPYCWCLSPQKGIIQHIMVLNTRHPQYLMFLLVLIPSLLVLVHPLSEKNPAEAYDVLPPLLFHHLLSMPHTTYINFSWPHEFEFANHFKFGMAVGNDLSAASWESQFKPNGNPSCRWKVTGDKVRYVDGVYLYLKQSLWLPKCNYIVGNLEGRRHTFKMDLAVS